MGTLGRIKQRTQRVAWIVGAIVVPVLAMVVVGTWLGKSSLAASAPVPAEVAGLENMQRGFSWVAATVKPSVVFIEVEQKMDTQKANAGQEMPDLRDLLPPDFPFSFPDPENPQQPNPRIFPNPSGPPRQQPTPRIPYGQGSGVIVDAGGYILTNEHVIDNAAKIMVHLTNGDAYPAQLVQTDALTDLAIIKIEPREKLIPAALASFAASLNAFVSSFRKSSSRCIDVLIDPSTSLHSAVNDSALSIALCAFARNSSCFLASMSTCSSQGAQVSTTLLAPIFFSLRSFEIVFSVRSYFWPAKKLPRGPE